MKIERFDAVDARSGMREINAKYGDDVLIISNSRLADKNRFVIAVNHTPPKPAPKAASAKVEACDDNALQALTLLMSSQFETLERDLKQLRRNQASLYLLTQGKNAASEASEQKLVQLLANSTVPVNLLSRMQKITARCANEVEIVQAIRIFLSRQLPGATELPDAPTAHILTGAPGVGKTLAAIKLCATINARDGKSALVVGYKYSKHGARAQLQILGEEAGVHVDHASDSATLLSIINRYIGVSSVIIDVPGNFPASELEELRQCLPSALFHLVMAKDHHQHDSHYLTNEPAFKFASAIITRLDCNGSYWPLIHSLMEHKMPLLFGGHSASVSQPLLRLAPKMLIKEVIRSMKIKRTTTSKTATIIPPPDHGYHLSRHTQV